MPFGVAIIVFPNFLVSGYAMHGLVWLQTPNESRFTTAPRFHWQLAVVPALQRMDVHLMAHHFTIGRLRIGALLA